MAITVALAIVGGLTLAGTGAVAAYGAWGPVMTPTSIDSSVSASGLREFTLDAGRGSVAVRFDDVSTVGLVSTDSLSGWSMQRVGSTLKVQSPQVSFDWWPGLWFGDDTLVTVVLPRSLERDLDANLHLGAGSLDVRGDFRSLSASVGAGSFTVEGSMPSLTVDLAAGSADVNARDVSTAELTVSAGRMNASLGGTAPDQARLHVSAGSMGVAFPAGTYDLAKDVSAGSLENELTLSQDSRHRVSATVSAGSLKLIAAH